MTQNTQIVISKTYWKFGNFGNVYEGVGEKDIYIYVQYVCFYMLWYVYTIHIQNIDEHINKLIYKLVIILYT